MNVETAITLLDKQLLPERFSLRESWKIVRVHLLRGSYTRIVSGRCRKGDLLIWVYDNSGDAIQWAHGSVGSTIKTCERLGWHVYRSNLHYYRKK